MLLKYDVKANAKRRSDIAPILFAIDAITKNESKKESITQCITKLVEHNADVNCAFQDGDFAGETPIISAIRLDQIDLAKLLIEKKANVSACAKNGRTAFFYAANKRNIDILNMLISASKDPETDLNRRYNENKPLTHIVLEKINDFNAPDVLKFLEILHENGVRVDLTDAYGETPLHIAARKDSAKNIVEWLIHNGCDPQQMNASERTVFSVADKKIIPVIIKAYNEEESIKAIEESRIYKEELEKEEMINRRTARDLHLATRTPSETDEKKIESKKRTKLLAMTKRGGTLRTPTLSKGSKFTPVKKLEARPWGGSKQTAKFQRDTRLKIRKVKKDILDQLAQLREDVQKIKKKIDIEAGNISESDHSNDENYEEDNENDIDSYQNSLPQPGTNYRNNDSNSSLNNEEKDETHNLQNSLSLHNEEEDKMDLQIQQEPHNDDEDKIDLQIQQEPHNDENEELNLDFQNQQYPHIEEEEKRDMNNSPTSPNDEDDLNFDFSPTKAENETEFTIPENTTEDNQITPDGEQNDSLGLNLNSSDSHIDLGE